ncbi:MAG: O-antigen ligase family protein [bacterium]|nr:O-antigen ligase family protein [bacterium]
MFIRLANISKSEILLASVLAGLMISAVLANMYFSRMALIALCFLGIIFILLLFQSPVLGAYFIAVAHTSPFWAYHRRIVLFVMLASLMISLAKKFLAGKPILRISPSLKWYLPFIAWFAATIMWAGTYDDLNIFNFTYILVLMIVLTELIRTPRELAIWIFASLVGVAISAIWTLVGMLDFFAGGQVVEAIAVAGSTENVRFYGGWGNPNEMAQSLVPALGFGLAFLRTRVSNLLRFFTWSCLILGVLAVAAAMSRGAMLSLAIIYLMVSFADRHRALLLSTFAVLVIATIAFVPTEFAGRFESLMQGRRDASLNERLHLTEAGISMAEDSFPIGIGAGASRAYSADHVFFLKSGAGLHNTFLEILAESGVVGLCLFILFLISLLMQVRVLRWKIDANNFGRNVAICMNAVFVSIIFGFMFNSWTLTLSAWPPIAFISVRTSVLGLDA